MEGRTLGSWVVDSLHRRGGMGAVYFAHHARLGTPVALKLLSAGGERQEELEQRFVREAQLTARIRHPGVVRVHDFGSEEGQLYLVMERVEGESLRALCRDGGLPLARALELGVELLEILGAAHAEGVVHRDVKPENVLVDATGSLRVVDFGISRVVGEEGALTATGELLGTPEYMAPEQILDPGDEVDHRADLHAVAVVLYELLTGAQPFRGTNAFQALKRVEALEPDPPSTLRSEIPAALDDCLLRALAKDKSLRHDRAEDFAAELRAVAASVASSPRVSSLAAAGQRGDPAARPLMLGAGLGLILGVLLGFWLDDGASTSFELLEQGAEPPGATAEEEALLELRSALAHPRERAEPLRATLDRLVTPLSAEARRWRGVALFHLGDLEQAEAELRAAREAGVPGAAASAAAVWHALRTMFAQRGPGLVDGGDRGAAFEAEFGPGPHEDPLVRAAAMLAQGDASGARVELAKGRTPSAEAAFLDLLAAAERGAPELAELRVETQSDFPACWPLQYLHQRTGSAAEDADALAALVEGLDRRCATRYRVELRRAYLRGEAEALRRLGELAVACGGGDRVVVEGVVLSMQLAAGGGSLPPDLLRSWRIRLRGVDAQACPEVVPALAALDQVLGE